MKKFLLASLCLLTLAGCGDVEYDIKTGKVLDKKYIPSKTVSFTRLFFNGKTTVPMAFIESRPEKYIFKVSYIATKEIVVSREEYEKTVIGDVVNFLEVKN